MSKEILPKADKPRWPMPQEQRRPAGAKDAFAWGQPTTINHAVINLYLDNLGVKHSCLGYRYLIFAIQLKSMFHKIGLMRIYKMIAQECDANSSQIERAIRYAIAPYGLTNKEFIAKAIDDMMYRNS